MNDNDPLWKLRHALLGLGLALLLSVPTAALIARALGDLIHDSYLLRAALYSALLAYVVVGAVVLFLRVARHESRHLSLARLVLWWLSLWLWPVLLARGTGPRSPGAPGASGHDA